MGKVLCFGELLLRLIPSTDGKWLSNNSLPVYVGGAEANVAIALAFWGQKTSYVTALPDNLLSQQMVAFLNSKDVETSSIYQCGDRVGIYYLPESTDLKTGGVIYDRDYSSFSQLRTGWLDWDSILEGVDWFHFSAICPALNKNVAEVCEEGLYAAKRKNIKISLDLNYRSKLWQYGKKPFEVMPNLASYCDLIMGNVWAAETLLNVQLNKDLINKNEKSSYLEQALVTSQEIQRQYSNCNAVANTFRFTSQDEGISYYGTLFTNHQLYCSNEYNANKVVDKVGSGDCFMAGLIYGFMNKLYHQETINFAAAAAFQKLFVKGDSIDKSVQEIKKSIKTK